MGVPIVFGLLKKKTSERRKLARVPVPAEAGKMVARSLTTKERVHIQIVDISQRGLRFRGNSLDGLLAKSDGVELSIPAKNGSIIINGKVVWIRGDHAAQHYEGGIAFDDVPMRKQEQINEFIDHVRGASITENVSWPTDTIGG